MQSLQNDSERHHIIQQAAYYLWQQRGCSIGSPEIDWFRAKEELRQDSEYPSKKPAIVAMAETVGSALGSVAGIMESVGSLVRSEDASGAE